LSFTAAFPPGRYSKRFQIGDASTIDAALQEEYEQSAMIARRRHASR
jgi:hypothetical protein